MFLEHLQGQSLHHLPRLPVSASDYSFGEVFLNIQPQSPLMQLEAIPPSPVTTYIGEKDYPHLNITSLQVIVQRRKVCPEPLLQTKSSPFPQPPRIRLVLYTPHSFTALLWTHFRVPMSFLDRTEHSTQGEDSPELSTGDDHIPAPAGSSPLHCTSNLNPFLLR